MVWPIIDCILDLDEIWPFAGTIDPYFVWLTDMGDL